MNNFFKSKYKVIGLLLSCMIVVTVVSVVFTQNFIFGKDKPVVEEPEVNSSEEEPPVKENETPEYEEPVVFRTPDPMRGTYLTAGVEFLTSKDDDAETIKKQIDTALKQAKEYTLNTIIINPKTEDGVIYSTSTSLALDLEIDVMEYLVEKAKEDGFFVFSVFDTSDYNANSSTSALSVNAGSYNQLSDNVSSFADKYKLDGIVLTGYQNTTTDESYSLYSKLGGAMGFDNYMKQEPESVINTAIAAIKKSNPNTQLGILADPVWANSSDNEDGSNTTASYTALNNGNIDTRGLVTNQTVDFVMVNAYGSTTDTSIAFSEVIKWWANLALDSGMNTYVIQASSLAGTDSGAWSTKDELMKQAAMLDETAGIRGNCFDSLTKLTANPGGATDSLMKYYVDDIEPELLLTQLEITKPAQSTYTTNETQVVFTGASDPTEKITINDELIPTDQSGYFTAYYDLKAGTNTFTISHKDKTLKYNITRQVDLLTDISPAGSITTDGSMEIAISAIAYENSKVTAYVSGQAIELKLDENVVDESQRDSSYKRYTGVFTAPSSTSSMQNLGAITVTASWEGQEKSLQGASISVNKKAQIENGVPVIVNVDQAMTYPGNTLDNIPRATTFPLPKGAMDYAVGDEIEYKGVAYTILASGLRVKSSDVSVSKDFPESNTISDIKLSVEDGFTYITLTTAQKISYNFGYTKDAVNITFNNTASAPNSADLGSNPIFSSAKWSGSTLTLPLVKQGGFMGFKGYYNESGNLVFKFNNPPSSMSNARIVIDPGHGGKDVGALGFLSDYHESTINRLIATQVADELRSRGATVLLLDTTGSMDLPTRIAKAEAFNADLLISIHNNTAPNAAAKGTEVYYFYPFSYNLANSSSSAVSSQLSTTNRGAKQSYYIVTLSSQFPSVLVECGFMSNREEYEKLIRTKYHERIAIGIADGVSSAISAAYTGIDGGVTTVVDDPTTEIKDPVKEENTNPEKPSTINETVSLSQAKVSLIEGAKATLTAKVSPSTANQTISWRSSNTSVATVNNGVVTAVKSGAATITATSNSGKRASCTVEVAAESSSGNTGNSGNKVLIQEIALSTYTVTLDGGKNHQLDIGIFPEDASNKTLTWKSSDEKIATVNSAGLINAVAQGTATITATTNDGSTTTAKCTVTVTGNSTSGGGDDSMLKNAEYIELFNQNTTMFAGTSQTLAVRTDKGTTVPNNALVWSSSDTKVATVDANGVVTAKRIEGTTTIEAHDRADNLFDYIKITVTRNKIEVEKITLSHTTLTIPVGTVFKDLKATISPADANASTLSWRVTNTTAATVDSNGVITAKAAGSTTLIVKNGNVQASCKIIVTDKLIIEELALDVNQLEMQVGDEDYLMAEIYPDTVKPTLVWTSSRPSIVTVDASGNIKAIAEGTATITVTIDGTPNLKDTCTITVVP